MLSKRDLQFVRLAVRWKLLSAEQGEECLFLKQRFASKFPIEEILRRRGYVDDAAIEQLSQSALQMLNRRARPMFRRPEAVQEVDPRDERVDVAPDAVEAPPPMEVPPPESGGEADDRTVIEFEMPALPPPLTAAPSVEPGSENAPRARESKPDAAWGLVTFGAESGAASQSEPEEKTVLMLPVVRPTPASISPPIAPHVPPSIEPPPAVPIAPSTAPSSLRREPLRRVPEIIERSAVARHLPSRLEASAELGGTFGPFRIGHVIARGSVAVVYFAQRRDGGTQTAIALKVLQPGRSLSTEQVSRIMLRASAAREIDSPYVARVFEVGEADGCSYVAMEYIDGWTIRDRIDSGERLVVLEAVKIARDVARALADAEKLGFTHGDVRPENIFVARDGRVLLADFGLAREVAAAVPSMLDGARPIVGTPGYMPAELVLGHEADHRADLFALGATLFEMLTGTPAFPGRSVEARLRGVLRPEVPDPRSLDPSLPEFVARVTTRLLARNKGDRYGTSDEAVLALEQTLSAIDVEERPAVHGDRPRATPPVLLRALLWSASASAIVIGLPICFASVAAWASDAALFGASALVGSLFLLSALGLVRRGELPLPMSSAWLVRVQDAAGVVGSACLASSLGVQPPALLGVLVSAISALVLTSGMYGVLLRRRVAAARPDRGVGRVLAVLSDPSLRRWRFIHIPLLAALTSLAIVKLALIAYFSSKSALG